MTREIMQNTFACSRTDLIVNADKEAAQVRVDIVRSIAARLLAGEPLQYILGYETFMGMRIDVNPSVLIPRPETEELVEMIIDRNSGRRDLRVLDAGTGSGCIALALARNLPFSQVTGIDISPAAIEVARENAARLHVRARWLVADMLALAAPPAPLYDIIVSNPPYVLPSERGAMDENVTAHEPHAALFVPEDDPLRFYHALEAYGRRALAPGGSIYFELNPLTARQLAADMASRGWTDVELTADSNRRQRFLSAKLPSTE